MDTCRFLPESEKHRRSEAVTVVGVFEFLIVELPKIMS